MAHTPKTEAELEGKELAVEKVAEACVTSIEQILEMDSSPAKLAELRKKYPGAAVDEALHRLEDQDPEIPRDDERGAVEPTVAEKEPSLGVARIVESEEVQREAEESRAADTAGMGIQGVFAAMEETVTGVADAVTDALKSPESKDLERREDIAPPVDSAADKDPGVMETINKAGMSHDKSEGVDAPSAGQSAEHASDKSREGGGPAIG